MGFFEQDYLSKKRPLIISGTDEVGRGPLAGPVVSCTCGFLIDNNKNENEFFHLLAYLECEGVVDSKKMTAKNRQAILAGLGIEIAQLKSEQCYLLPGFDRFVFSISAQSEQVIDQINILQASLKSMAESYQQNLNFFKIKINERAQALLIDGNQLVFKNAPVELQQYPVVKGDQKSLLIGFASIVAKEFRDYFMEQMDQKFPGYGFAKHSGYPTKAHKLAISELGPSPIHRRSFRLE